MTTTAAVPDLYRARRGKVELVDVPELLLAAVDGQGDPGGPEFAGAIKALYGLSYTAHFLAKKQLGTAPRVLPLEALWWVDDHAAMDTFTRVAMGEADPNDVDRSLWRWRAFIVQPEPLDEHLLAEALIAAEKKATAPMPRLEVSRWREGLSAQLLHVGPYSAEAPSIVALHEGLTSLGYRPRGRHHEIYLGDPRRSAPEKLRTILRHPVEPAG
jgi:hypothetical protein